MTSPTGTGPTLLRLGQTVTVLRTAEGGAIGAEVGPDGSDRSRKRLGPLMYEDLALTMTIPPASKTLRDWVTEAFTERRTPADGEIVGNTGGANGFTVRRFTDALISSIDFPEMDVRDTTPGNLIVRLTPTTLTVETKGDAATAPAAQLRWRSSDFALAVTGLDATAVVRIDNFTVDLPVVHTPDRTGRPVPIPVPGRPDLPTLQVEIPFDRAASWIEWHQDFVVKGNNGPGAERTGTLQLFTAGRTKVLATLALEGLGIAKLTWPTLGATETPTVTAELYAQRLALTW